METKEKVTEEVVTTPTPEEQLRALQEKVAQSEARATEKEEGFKTLQRQFLAEQTSKKELEQRLTDREETSAFNRALIGLVAEQRGTDEDDVIGEVRTRKPDLLKQYDEIEQRRQQKAVEAKVRGYQRRVEALGLKESDRDYRDVYFAVSQGNDSMAESIISDLETQAEKPKPEAKVLDEETINRLVEERIARKKEEDELLKTDTGSSAGGGSKLTASQVEKMSPDERFRRSDEIAKMSLGYTRLEK